MDKLIKQIKENRVVNILLNHNGTLTRKEYWFAMIMLFLFSTVPLTSHQAIYSLVSIMSENISFNGEIQHISGFYLVNNVLSSLSYLPLLPYASIVLYSSFIITFKRTKGHFNNPVRWLLGLCTYLVPISISMLRSTFTYTYLVQDNPIIANQLSILIYALIALAFISVIILSCLPNPDDEREYDNKYGSINFTFKLMGVNLIYAILLGLIYIWIISSNNILGGSSSTGQLPLFAVSLAYLTMTIFLIVKRSQDANLPVYIPLTVMIMTTIITSSLIICSTLELIKQITFTVTLIPTFFFILISVLNALFFIFIALPTKAPRDEVYW